ncbi:alpha/beta fold hydrolase [Poseidonocella sp. HB161398]|uniref:alpha/beta fold hydrolase n=1 Tax=Poseidonocella sp. HB161398 TaxID=2320855 RepID=UPI001F104B91|nr:alpha/beta hydrolase [Poseidonocella sp. HB161398]
MAASAVIAMASAKIAAYFGIHLRAERRETRAEAEHPPEGEMIEADGVRLHMKVEGSGPPLVLLHGAGGNMRDFEPLLPQLAAQYTVIRFDRPGLGHSALPARYRSPWRNAAPTPAEQARLMAGAAGRLGLGPALVLGQSYGGAVALAWALEHPGKTAGLVLVSAASQPWPGGRLGPLYPIASHPLGAVTLVPLISAFTPRKVVDRALAAIFAPQEPPAGYAAMIGARLSLRRGAFRANARQVNALWSALAAMAPCYGSLALPVEMVHGTADRVVPLDIHSAATVRAIPGAALAELPGIGHMPHHAAPDAVLGAVERAAARAGWHPRPGSGNVAP